MKTLLDKYFDPIKSKELFFENGIAKYTPNVSYSTGNFSKLREKFGEVQQDSINGTHHRLDTILSRTNWSKDDFKNKTVLECGCGAGPDTEILLSLGAKVVAVDLTSAEVTKKNLGENQNYALLQASIDDLPLKKDSFDIVYCHRVLQHTPNPAKTLDHILRFVKPEGKVFVHSYGYSLFQFFRWKYFLRPITKRMPSKLLYNIINFFGPFLYYLSSFFYKFGKVGKGINYFLIPFENYSNIPHLKNKPKNWLINYGIMITFDYLSPRYDSPIKPSIMREISKKHLDIKSIDFEVYTDKSTTLLRSIG